MRNVVLLSTDKRLNLLTFESCLHFRWFHSYVHIAWNLRLSIYREREINIAAFQYSFLTAFLLATWYCIRKRQHWIVYSSQFYLFCVFFSSIFFKLNHSFDFHLYLVTIQSPKWKSIAKLYFIIKRKQSKMWCFALKYEVEKFPKFFFFFSLVWKCFVFENTDILLNLEFILLHSKILVVECHIY